MGLGFACGAAAFLIGQLGWLSGLDAGSYDLALRTRPPTKTAPRVAVIEIDDVAIHEMGRWPWPWSRHALLLQSLHKYYQPAVVVFDILFTESDAPEEEQQFAEAVRDAGNVYLAAFFTSVPRFVGGSAEVPWLAAEYVGAEPWGGSRYTGVVAPTRALAAAAAGVGPVNVVPELDGCVRRVPLVMDVNGVPRPSLSASAVNSVVNPEGKPVRVALGEFIDLGGYRVPIDSSGETWVNYARDGDGGTPSYPRHRYTAVLSGEAPRDALKDKVVIVGFSATGMADVHPTPLSPASFGAHVNAQVVNGLLQGSFIRLAGWPARLTMALVIALAVAFLVRAFSPGRALLVTAVIAALAVAVAGFGLWRQGVWLGTASATLAALMAYGLTMVERYAESERASLTVRASLDALARASRLIGSLRLRPELLSEIRSQVGEVTGARQVNLYFMDDRRQALHLAVPPGAEIEPVSYALGEGPVGWVARHGSVDLIRQIDPASELHGMLARTMRLPVGSVMYASLRIHGQVVGVVEVARSEGEPPFEERHMALLEALANEATVALENTTLYEQLEGKIELANRDLVAAYRDLKGERDRVAAMVSNMADGVLLTDADKAIVFVNPAVEHMFGVTAEELEGRPVAEALPYPELLSQLEEGGEETVDQIPRIRVERPRRMVLSPRTVRLRTEAGEAAGAITVVNDITLLEELSEMKTEFVSLVSHELRTPLTSIMGFAQTLRGDAAVLTEEARAEFLGIIEQESNRLVVMINDLLDVSRMEAGRELPLNCTLVDLRELARHVVRFQQVTTDRHNFVLEFPEGGLEAEADRDKVEQILTNLVSNAIKYSPNGGDIVIAGSTDDAEAVLRVTDKGVGMTEEQVGQLFQRYQRVDRDSIKGIRGTGLGLYLVRGLVEAHAGRLWVTSEPGKGSSFLFALPRRRPSERSAV